MMEPTNAQPSRVWLSLHRRVAAVALAFALVVLISGNILWSAIGVGFLFLACSVGLLGEARYIYHLGELTARHWAFASQFQTIKGRESPARFKAFVFVLALLGTFCLAAGVLTIWLALGKHAA